MANGRTPIDLGFAEFAAQLVAELQEAVLSAQATQDSKRAEIADLAAMSAADFARRFVRDEQVEAELRRLFPAPGGKAHRLRVGLAYRPASATQPESPPIQTKLAIRFGPRDLRVLDKRRAALTREGVRTVREAVRLRIAEARLAALRQTAAQGIPRVVVDSGRVNVKLLFRLVDLDKLGERNSKNEIAVPLKPLGPGRDIHEPLARLRLVVRQVNEQTAPVSPTEASGIGELDLTFKTV